MPTPAPVPAPAPTPALTPDVVRGACAYVHDWLAFRRRALRVPGVQAAVRLGGDLVHSSAHGHADVEGGVALRTDHVFRVASHSKTFTATAVLRLVEAGRLRLDDTLGGHLPWVAQESPELAAASLRELLSHAAGVTRDGTAGDFWQLDGEFPDAAGLRAAVRGGGSLVGRSERFKYSNVGYALLGAVLEQVTGRGYAEHVSADLVEPLGLTSTTPDLPAAGDLVTGYSSLLHAEARVPLPHAATRAMAAATGFCSTAEDLTAWFSAHAAGRGELLDDHTKRVAQHAEWTVPGWTGEPSQRQYGLGLILERCGSRALVGHSGGFPGQITKSVLDPAAGLAVSVLTNSVDGPASDLALGVVKLLDLFAVEWSERTGETTGLDAFCERWANLWGVLDVVRCGSTLLGIDPSADDPVATPVRLEVVDASTVRVARDGGFGSYAETWSLGHRDDGTPALRTHSGMTMVPLDAHVPGAPASAGPPLSPATPRG